MPRTLFRFRSFLRRRSSPRLQAGLVLAAWLLGLAAPLWHEDAGHESDSAVTQHERGGECSGRFEPVAAADAVAGTCPDGEGCADPRHHHHAHPSHDATTCPTCSSIFARAHFEIPSLIAPPASSWRLASIETVAATPAERSNAALARGPPEPRSLRSSAAGAC